MKRHNTNHYEFSTVLLMTSRFHADIITKLLIAENKDINVLNFIHPDQLNVIPDEYLMSSRLISFGSRHYIPSSLLDRVGYGAYNFHPGPPDYPGWAPFYYAIYDRAAKFGVTCHEMTAKIDAGDIVAVRTFEIPPHCSTQTLVNLTEHEMFEMFKELSPAIACQSAYLPTTPIRWQREPLKKKDFINICHIPLDIDEAELKRRIFAFGDSDGSIFPFLYHDNKKYRLAFDGDHPERHSFWLHGQRFVAE